MGQDGRWDVEVMTKREAVVSGYREAGATNQKQTNDDGKDG